MKRNVLFCIVLAVVLVFGGNFSGQAKAGRQSPVQDLIRSLEVGKPVSYGSLTVVPVYLTRIKDKTKYVTLEDAMKHKWLEITELEGGRVPRVKISNHSKHMIYLMGGEILTGCKQDRILASDLLLAPGTQDLTVPVYCVEHGRWTHRSKEFYSKNNIGTYKLRAKAQEKSAAAQSEIWDQISRQNRKMGVASPTSAYQDAYENKENVVRIEKIEKRMKVIPQLKKDTVGVVIGLGGKIVNVDIFANSFLFKKQWPKILRSSALSSINNDSSGTLGQNDAVNFLKSFMDKIFQTKKSLALGYEWTAIDSAANILALVYKGSVIHLAGFPQEKGGRKETQRDTPEQRIRVIRQENIVPF